MLVAYFTTPVAFVVVVVSASWSAVVVDRHCPESGAVALQGWNRVAQLSLRRVVWFSDAGLSRNCLRTLRLNLFLAVLVREDPAPECVESRC